VCVVFPVQRSIVSTPANVGVDGARGVRKSLLSDETYRAELGQRVLAPACNHDWHELRQSCDEFDHRPDRVIHMMCRALLLNIGAIFHRLQ